MSRGPGRWQRAVLSECERVAAEPIEDLLLGRRKWVTVEHIWLSVTSDHPVIPLNTYQQKVRAPMPYFSHRALPPSSPRESIRRAMRTLARTGAVQLGVTQVMRPSCSATTLDSRGCATYSSLAARLPLDAATIAAERRNLRDWTRLLVFPDDYRRNTPTTVTVEP